MADYQEQKSKNFAKYCKEGKVHLVRRWIDNPNVNANWNKHSPMRYAVREHQIDVIKMLLANPQKIRTDYENDTKELKGSSAVGKRDPDSPIDDREWVDRVVNPFTEAMLHKHFDILDLFVKSGKFKVFRDVYLDLLVEMQDEELNKYFMDMDGFHAFMISLNDPKYTAIFPPDIQNLFSF